MKSIITAVLFLLSSLGLHSQTLNIVGIDTTAYPVIKTLFYAFDGNNNLLGNLNSSDFLLSVNSMPFRVDSLSCTSSKTEQISLVISLDASNSMVSGEARSAPPKDIAVEFTKTLCNATIIPPSELALQSSDSRAIILHDLSGNKQEVIAALSGYIAQGGNNYKEQLLNDQAGALNVIKNGRYKRYAVIITDGKWGALSKPDLDRCIDTCHKYNITLITIMLSPSEADPNGISSTLKAICDATGGEYIASVYTINDAREYALGLQQKIQGGKPCELFWRDTTTCANSGELKLELKSPTISQTAYYTAPISLRKTLGYSTDIISFGGVKPGAYLGKQVVITAPSNDSITINNVMSSDLRFGIANYGGSIPPFTLKAGEQRTIIVGFIPTDSGYSFGTLTFNHDGCNPYVLSVSGGYPSKRPSARSLAIVRPNGGEHFGVGDSVDIQWQGILREDSVKIEYSTNAGDTWIALAEKANGLHHPWKVPFTPSDSCLLRITHLRTANSAPVTTIFPGSTDFALNNKGDKILIKGTKDNIARVYYSETGLLQMQVGSSNGKLTQVAWNVDSNIILTEYNNNSFTTWTSKGTKIVTNFGLFELWNPQNNRILTRDNRILYNDGFFIRKLVDPMDDYGADSFRVFKMHKWNPTKPLIVAIQKGVAGGGDSLRLWNVDNENQLPAPFIKSVGIHSGVINDCKWSPSGERLATAGIDSTAFIFNTTLSLLQRLKGHTGNVTSVAWSMGDRYVASGSVDNSVRVWHTANGELKHSFDFGAAVNEVCFSPDGKLIAAAGNDNTAKIWEVESGNLLRVLTGHDKPVLSIGFSPEGRRVITRSKDSTIRIWDVDSTEIQQVVSNSNWQIFPSSIEGLAVNCGKVVVGTSRDTVVKQFIVNKNMVYPVVVDSIRLTGANASDFSLSVFSRFVLDNNSGKTVEVHFAPSAVGKRTAFAEVYVSGQIFSVTITGEGLASGVVLSKDIDFGRVIVNKSKDTIIPALIKNISTSPVTITDIKLTLDATQFSILAGGGGFTLSEGESRMVTLQFAPVRLGKTNALLSIDIVGSTSALQVALSGEGIDKTGVEEDTASEQHLYFSPNPADECAELFIPENRKVIIDDITDITGQRVGTSVQLESTKILVETWGLPSGVYYIHVTASGKNVILPIVVRH